MRLGLRLVTLVLSAAAAAVAQDHVLSSTDDFLLPAVVPRRQPDADLLPALTRFNGQRSLNGPIAQGVVDRMLPNSLGRRFANEPVVAEGVVLRSDAFLAPDRTGVVTVLTVAVSAVLLAPESWSTQGEAVARRRSSLGTSSAASHTILRFLLAGGVVYSSDIDGVAVQQIGVNYPDVGDTLVFFGERVVAADGARASSALLLVGACALREGECASIDGNQVTSDALSSRIPGGLAAAEAFNLEGAAMADPGLEGVRDVAEEMELRYDLHSGDLRRQPGPELPMLAPYSPARGYELLVRAHVLSTDCTLTSGGAGLVSHATASVEQVLRAPEGMAHPRTLEVYDRGGLLRLNEDTATVALLPSQLPLVEGAEYFLAVGLTEDSRWELRASWRIVGDEVFAMDRPRGALRSRGPDSYWPSTAQFLH